MEEDVPVWSRIAGLAIPATCLFFSPNRWYRDLILVLEYDRLSSHSTQTELTGTHT